MNIDLQGRTALITGASKGLGLATALRLAASGAHVAIVARGREALDEAYEAIKEKAGPRRVAAHVCDVTQPTQIDAAFHAVRAQLGPLDILINNAGGHALGHFHDITDAMWSHDIDVKLMATVRMTRLVWPDMIERRWGRVINVLNTFAKAPAAGTAPTAVTRAAQLALTKILSKEGAPHNVLANALLVGLIQSDQIQRLLGHNVPRDGGDFAQQQIGNRQIPLGRIGEPGEFADIACFLASDHASYITGTAINVDGGMSAVI
ncbi:SDR family oxidoreductase [Paraburkholderia aspalathi]|jgi:3-oxoacyl-[acyl-carrier protein] reductase|uniref:NAD(P)-dependent dehydrogenase, short-chain alcohol dehydrogenase family n=1 Tax=Paraburkholderia aspalathi TaxID=1324617 RepID=A0A1I7DCR6_9BURK|nr:SDR family oxidoreductase [Paraburkholderia aspalathi]SFU09394.1 NAD(P)-dependent dehydrogenase, short-chain alcohol dehydrogenase family [Paraburkholderia aspalathi]